MTHEEAMQWISDQIRKAISKPLSVVIDKEWLARNFQRCNDESGWGLTNIEAGQSSDGDWYIQYTSPEAVNFVGVTCKFNKKGET